MTDDKDLDGWTERELARVREFARQSTPELTADGEERIWRHVVTASPESKPRTSRRSGRRPRVVVGLALSLVAVVGGLGVGLGLLGESTPSARAFTGLVRSEPIDGSEIPELRGVVARLGADVDLSRTWKTTALGRAVYLVNDGDRWCLSAQGSAADARRVVTCTNDEQIRTHGLVVGLDRDVVAVIPDGVRGPQVRTPNGTTREVHPTPEGVVGIKRVTPGTLMTFYSTTGERMMVANPGRSRAP